MCGRKTLTKGKTRILEELSIDDWDESYHFEPSYNIAPTQISPILLFNGRRTVIPMRWGLIPAWAKDMKMAARMINARSETLSEKPSFRNLLPKKRCIVITDGYYEWKQTREGKIPYYIHPADDSLLCMAGLWERWQPPNSLPVHSYTIITTSPSGELAHIHHRMPAIIDRGEIDLWIKTAVTTAGQAVSLLHPYDGHLEAYPVSSFVNSPRNNSDQCIQQL